MSDGMPGAVAKGKVLAELEEVLFHHRDKLWEALKSVDGTEQSSVADALENSGFPRHIAQHLRDHLFPDEPPGYFPGHPQKNGICREGLLKAIELAAGEPPLPIECYWVCTGGYFQLIVLPTPRQVTVLFLTPPPPANLMQLPSSVLENVHLIVDRYTAYEIQKAGAYPVLDPSHPDGARYPTGYEQPVVSDTGTSNVKEVVVRRAP